MAYFEYAFLLLVGAIIIENAICLECYSCNGIADKISCNQTTTCNLHEYCLLDINVGTFNMRCANTIECSSVNHSATIIGREVLARQSTACHECCSVDMCNMELCDHMPPSSCIDDETVDCAKMNSIFNICQDVHKAKLVCPQFCNLCTIVDGHWSVWSHWSTCDVTCGNGTETRTRTCTNPPPANGGIDCVDQSTEAKSCVLDKCPVHGGWSLWSEWGTCSGACHVGMQLRDRACNNQYPSRYGDNCFGDSRNYRVCDLSDCLGERVSFTATGISINGSSLIFPNVIHNFGNGYDKTTGGFTCTIPGTYYIKTSLSKLYGVFTYFVRCEILVNNSRQVGLLQDPVYSNDIGGYSISMSGIFHLNVNDFVYIGNCQGQTFLYNSYLCSFSGFLVTPDII